MNPKIARRLIEDAVFLLAATGLGYGLLRICALLFHALGVA